MEKKLRLRYILYGPKKEETDQQTENLKLFMKTGKGPKKEETDQQTEFKKVFENRKRTQKKRKRTQKKRKPINKLRI